VRPLTHAAHKKFVTTEGWSKEKTARGRTGDHFRYALALADGRILSTRVSYGSGAINDPTLIAVILRDQLEVSEEAFWACVENGALPPRPASQVHAPQGERLDYMLVRNLISKVGLSMDEVGSLSREEALRRWTEISKAAVAEG
jgi:hypothetical protein